jgi:hypothetical protein
MRDDTVANGVAPLDKRKKGSVRKYGGLRNYHRYPPCTYPKVAYLYFVITLDSSRGELGLFPTFKRAFIMAVNTLSRASSGCIDGNGCFEWEWFSLSDWLAACDKSSFLTLSAIWSVSRSEMWISLIAFCSRWGYCAGQFINVEYVQVATTFNSKPVFKGFLKGSGIERKKKKKSPVGIWIFGRCWLKVPKCVSWKFFFPLCSRDRISSFWQLIAVRYNEV